MCLGEKNEQKHRAAKQTGSALGVWTNHRVRLCYTLPRPAPRRGRGAKLFARASQAHFFCVVQAALVAVVVEDLVEHVCRPVREEGLVRLHAWRLGHDLKVTGRAQKARPRESPWISESIPVRIDEHPRLNHEFRLLRFAPQTL